VIVVWVWWCGGVVVWWLAFGRFEYWRYLYVWHMVIIYI